MCLDDVRKDPTDVYDGSPISECYDRPTRLRFLTIIDKNDLDWRYIRRISYDGLVFWGDP